MRVKVVGSRYNFKQKSRYMKKELINFRKSMTGRGYRRIEEFTDLDWRLIEITIGIFGKHPSPNIEFTRFRRELAKAANIRLIDAGWYITDVLTFDPIINEKSERVVDIQNSFGQYLLSLTDAFKKYYDERKAARKETPGSDPEIRG